jgi:hypothetical protein
VIELHFQHVDPSSLRCLVIGERIVAEGPGVTFTPKSIHEGIDELDRGTSVELRCQQPDQLPKRLLKKRMVEARLIARIRILQEALRRRAAFFIANDQINRRHFFENEIR